RASAADVVAAGLLGQLVVMGLSRGKVPAQTMLLLFCAQAPRTPHVAPDPAQAALFPAESAYFWPRNQPSWRADDSPSMSVLLSPSGIVVIGVRVLSANTALKLMSPVLVLGAVRPNAAQTFALLFDRVTAI